MNHSAPTFHLIALLISHGRPFLFEKKKKVIQEPWIMNADKRNFHTNLSKKKGKKLTSSLSVNLKDLFGIVYFVIFDSIQIREIARED